MNDLVAYEKVVRELAKTKSDVVYYNSGSDHATIVLENILLNSKSEIKVLTGSFDKVVCADSGERFITALKRFLLGKGKFKAIMNSYNVDTVEKNSVLDILKQYSASDEYKNNIEVRTSERQISLKELDVHFMVGDNTMYRLEYDTQKYLAEFSFKGEKKCSELTKKFDQLFATSTSVDLRALPY